MSLVQPATLAARIGVSATDAKLPGAISVSEAQVAAFIGADTIEQTDRTERVRPARDRDTIEISFGPLTSLTTISIEGETVSVSDFTLQPWGIGLVDLSKKFAANKTVLLTYKSGWANEAALPLNVKEAILIAGGQAFTLDPTGRQKVSESIGDWSASWQASPDATSLSSLSASVTTLLSRYRRPQL